MELNYITMRMVGVGDGKLTGDVVRESVLLHSWIEVNADCLWLSLKRDAFAVDDFFSWHQGEPFCGTAEWWVNAEGDGGRKWSCISQAQGLVDWH